MVYKNIKRTSGVALIDVASNFITPSEIVQYYHGNSFAGLFALFARIFLDQTLSHLTFLANVATKEIIPKSQAFQDFLLF